MYEEETHFVKLLLKQPETVLAHLTLVTLTFVPMTPKSIGLLCFHGRMCGPSLRNVGQGVFDWTRKGYRRTDRPTYMCNAIFFEGGHNNKQI